MFVLYLDMYTARKNLWGFVRRVSRGGEDGWVPPKLGSGLNESSVSGPPPPFEVLDLRSFLTRMAEGRPKVGEEAIEKLEGILTTMEDVTGAHLPSSEDMALFVAGANAIMQRS
jgi:hypothetical protein